MRTRFASTPALLIGAVGIVVGLAAPAVGHTASHLINGKTIKPNTVTGKQVKESTLGTVPKATIASGLTLMKWHPITGFQNGWTNLSASVPASYALDAEGIVHLRGDLAGGADDLTAFTLPAADAPHGVESAQIAVEYTDGRVGVMVIQPGGQVVFHDAVGATEVPSNDAFLNGISYSAH